MADARPADATKLRFEPATPGDVASLVALAGQVAVPGWSEASLASSLDDAGAIALLARDATGAPSGFVLARAAASEVEVLLVAVAPAAQRRGIGSALLAAALARAPDAEVAHLEVRASNAPAIALYRRAGFVAVGRRPRYYDGKEDALTMRRWLRKAER